MTNGFGRVSFEYTLAIKKAEIETTIFVQTIQTVTASHKTIAKKQGKSMILNHLNNN
ncbi:hypothetical protein ABRP58_10950 [Pectobacterium aroidearum]|uniref:hypothetical protein n=1 Tax=Pectobacterium TaxID=122277 RepID=UPI001F3A50C3|nr:hypothetical protein [Pectobacterium brasiliense]